MLSFLKSVNPATKPKSSPTSEKQEDAQPPTADVSIEPADESEGSHTNSDPSQPQEGMERPSSSSMPTIDSAPTVQGQPAAQTPVQPRSIPLPDSPNPVTSLAPPSPSKQQASTPSIHSQSTIQSARPMQSQSQSALPYSPPSANATGKDPRRFSFPSFAFLRSDAKQTKTQPGRKRSIPPPLQTQSTVYTKDSDKKSKAGRALSVLKLGNASSEKRAKECATIARAVIIGDHNTPPEAKPTKAKTPSKSDVARCKAQLLDPKSAAKVISHLRTLPPHADDTTSSTNIPIHAVCLDMTDKDMHEQHFCQLQCVATATASAVSTVLADVHLIDLLTAPNMGFGAPVTAQGLFAGSVPTAEAVIDGIEQITPQLMALGYATGKAILPDHKGVTVPADRISVLTYWWGLEVCLPPPTIAHLEAAESPGSALLNLLTALSVLNEGTREILPFIRYISQFVQSEWSMIKRADQGRGVVCTATWLIPVALVPRAWDFVDAPPQSSEIGPAGQTTPTSPSVKRFSATLTTPKPSTDVPISAARPSSAYSEATAEEEEPRPVISSEPPVLPELVVSSPTSIDGAPESIEGEAHKAHEKVQREGEALIH